MRIEIAAVCQGKGEKTIYILNKCNDLLLWIIIISVSLYMLGSL